MERSFIGDVRLPTTACMANSVIGTIDSPGALLAQADDVLLNLPAPLRYRNYVSVTDIYRGTAVKALVPYDLFPFFRQV